MAALDSVKKCLASDEMFSCSFNVSFRHRNDTRSGLASPNRTATLSGPVIGCVEVNVCKQVLMLQHFSISTSSAHGCTFGIPSGTAAFQSTTRARNNAPAKRQANRIDDAGSRRRGAAGNKLTTVHAPRQTHSLQTFAVLNFIDMRILVKLEE